MVSKGISMIGGEGEWEDGEFVWAGWGSWSVWMRSEVGVEGDCGGTEKGVGGEWKSSRGGEVGG